MADIESRLVPKDDESSAEILREDQAKINKFARLNNRKDELKAELEKLNVRLTCSPLDCRCVPGAAPFR